MKRRLIQPNLIRRSMAIPIGGGIHVSAGILTGREVVPDDGGSGWVRPADWPALPSPPRGTEAVVGLFAVNNTADERLAMIMSGAYTVDWGDGTVENFAASAVAEHNYVYSTLGTPVTVAGYKTAIIRVTPQAGQTLTFVNIATPHTGAVPESTKWLDIELRCPFASTFITGTLTALKPLVQRILVREHNAISFNQNFRGCAQLRSVPLFNTSNVTNMQAMFFGATALTAVPVFDTANVTIMTSMFSGAAALLSVPALDMRAVNVAATGFMLNASSCTAVAAFGMRFSIVLTGAALGAAALNTVFTNLGTASGAQTITITGNPGAATCDRTIATAKGWTVVG